MAESSQIIFSYKEVVEALLKKQGIHEGVWALYIKFGLAAMNTGPSEVDLHPAALVPVMEIGIQKADKETNIAVDAANVNPPIRSSIRRNK